jgi:hypothetical protein
MGRERRLRGGHEPALPELEHPVEPSPDCYALAMAGRLASIRRGALGRGIEDFLQAMRFAQDGERAFSDTALRLDGR